MDKAHQESAMINKNKILFLMLSLSLFGCDAMQQADDRNIEARTMIIGGVPVHDKDYKLADTHLSLNNQSLNEVQVNSAP